MKLLGLVTLYNPRKEQALHNLSLYCDELDLLIVWDNSQENHSQWFLGNNSVLYHWTGENVCIAPAVNFAWRYAKENDFEALLLMDQDSHWENFRLFRESVCSMIQKGIIAAFKPYVVGDDSWKITQDIVPCRRFINSGTILPVSLLDILGGADEVFALDALDTDLSIRILKEGYQILCLTSCRLIHTIGQPMRSRFLRLYTNDYGRFRTYTITKSHIICFRKNHHWMNFHEKKIFFKEILMWKFIRIVLVESDKWGRLRMFAKGIKEGVEYELKG